MPDTDFLSVGNERDVQTDQLRVGKSRQTIVAGTTVLRVVDRDHRSAQEVADLEASGVRVLRRRHLESYLLDDEALEALCTSVQKPEKLNEVLAAKQNQHTESVNRGNDPDDWKSPSGQISVECRRILGLTGGGNSREAFLADTVAPLIRPEFRVFQELRQDVFG